MGCAKTVFCTLRSFRGKGDRMSSEGCGQIFELPLQTATLVDRVFGQARSIFVSVEKREGCAR
ncbi:hypothetical protein EY675_09785 [Enterococcus casseliflavus]|nr:hypothetical protein [Enterococcus casseliflavus]RXA71523.1 hypothetical protein EQ870_06150 [Enterococcus casseliflavus]